MGNKTEVHEKSPLTTEPVLVETIVDFLSRDLELIKELLKRKNIMELNEQ